MLTYVVQQHDINRLVTVKNKGDVLAAAKEAFSLSGSYCLELYHKESELYVRIDNPVDDLPCGGRIRLVPVQVSSPPVSFIQRCLSTADTIPVLTMTASPGALGTPSCSKDSAVIDDLLVPCSSSVSSAVGETAQDPLALTDGGTSDNESSKDAGTSASRQVFVLDTKALPPSVRETMENGGDHSKGERRDIMAAVYEQYTKTCRSRYLNNVDAIAADVAEQFPGFGKGLRLSDRLKLVKESLINKFKNKRKACDDLEVQQRKKTPKKLPNFLPDISRVDGMKVHECVLDMKKGTLNESQVQEAMKITLPDRRRMLAGVKRARKSIAGVKAKYPLLFNENEIWEEYARLKSDARGGKAVQADALRELKKVLRNVPGHDAEGLVASLKELETVFVEEEGHHTYPVIVRRGGSAALFVEGVHCAALSGSEELQLLTWAVSFSVFCQPLYYLGIKNTATFLAVYVVHSDVKKDVPTALQAVLTKLLPAGELQH
ncbi:hypothetical protein FJT64_015180 [Amphibalanus amphitrite]|nr:uncharacterized protein LOC122364900 isoform X3 [Amphibalanus amphitrite]XP_043226488.1 uncharacterized protein LOC122383798 isoform X3 [Amphibalanus amphitrite]XP_043245077.1 uncharacterized protein LOC122393264 isoform X3 [Amphibalanus amphitrite]XP_043246229.1 uncharacterized protein LOC122393868 isoform X2 [Amphibalanus amphitrite]KAF0305232.1 hypothetical protein FJT64_023107 [Amphibalanus amphitrite]KAF0314361.1 hypothetical protein FJT64_015180 [Amphibalanus amphitrite]